MSLAIRRASAEDRQGMLELFERNFGEKFEDRFEWHNALNPAGSGWSWVIYEKSDKSLVGTTSLFPRRMYVDGKQITVGQVMYFAVDAGHRSLGPAVMLQRATFEPVDHGELAFCYDCPPHDEGMSTFVRLGIPAKCEIVRYVRPLRADEYLGRKIGRSIWTKPVISTANLILRMSGGYKKIPGLEITQFAGLFGEEFTDLDKKISSSGAIRCCRSAEVLNWQHREFPFHPKRLPNGKMAEINVLVARRQKELLAFAVYQTQSDHLTCVVDVFGVHLEEVGRALLEAVAEIAMRDKMSGLYAYGAHDSQLSHLLRSAGFRPRERAARVVAYENRTVSNTPELNNGLSWCFSQMELMR